jgi:hypothetical protein
MNENQAFTEHDIPQLLNDYASYKKKMQEVADILNDIAEEFYKDEIINKGVVTPYKKTEIKDKLLSLKVGEAIYTEDVSYRDRTRNHASIFAKILGMRFSTLKHGNGWMTRRVE